MCLLGVYYKAALGCMLFHTGFDMCLYGAIIRLFWAVWFHMGFDMCLYGAIIRLFWAVWFHMGFDMCLYGVSVRLFRAACGFTWGGSLTSWYLSVFGIHFSVLIFVYFYRLVFALPLGLSWCIHVRGIVHPEPGRSLAQDLLNPCMWFNVS